MVGALRDRRRLDAGTDEGEAIENLCEAVELRADHAGLRVSVTETEGSEVLVNANQPAVLATTVLKYQRHASGLTAPELDAEPTALSLERYFELLARLAPDLELTVGRRKAT